MVPIETLLSLDESRMGVFQFCEGAGVRLAEEAEGFARLERGGKEGLGLELER